MKRTRKATWFLSGMLCAAILANTVAPAAAALVAKTIQVYTGIEVFVDDVRIDAGETHGNPDAFAYNGTTYVAVAAISKSLGEKVYWDSENQKVYIGEHDGVSYNFLTVCPPYQNHNLDEYSWVKMSGKKYVNAISVRGDSGYALYNLDGQYDQLTFYVGHIDGEDTYIPDDASYDIYLDGELALSVDLDPEAFPEKYTLDLDGVLQMKIVGCYGSWNYALADLKIS